MRIALICYHDWDKGPIMPLARSLQKAGQEVHLFVPCSGPMSYYHKQEELHFHYCVEILRSMVYYLRTCEDLAGSFHILHLFHPAFLSHLEELNPPSNVKIFITLLPGLSIFNLEAVEEMLEGIITFHPSCPPAKGFPREKVFSFGPGIEGSGYQINIDPGKIKQEQGFGPFDPLIFFMGEMNREAELHRLLEAFFLVLEVHPQAKLVLVGDGPLLPYLEARAKVLWGGTASRFYRHLSPEEVVRLCRASHIVFLSTNTICLVEMLLRVWSSGKTVVLCGKNPLPFFEPGRDGFVVEPNIEAIAQLLCELLPQYQPLVDMGNHCRQRVLGEFSWDAIAQNLLKIYSK